MEVAAGAMTPLLGKLGDLLVDEFNLDKHVKKGVKSVITELEMMHAVLRKVGEIPPDQPLERIWAGKVRELSYDMEDAVDAYLVRVEDVDCVPSPTNVKNKIMEFLEMITKLFSKGKDLHHISDAIKEVRELAKELGELRQRYMPQAHANSTGDTIDPRLKSMYKDVTQFVGIDHTRDELIKMLMEGDEGSKQQLKTISIVGFGGLGKTTLAKAVYDKIKVQFHCGAFVSVSQKPNISEIFKKILYELDKGEYAKINGDVRHKDQLIDALRTFLQHKRYLIVIDDIWNNEAWEIIKCAFSNTSPGSHVMTTTRIGSVSEACCSSGNHIIYKMKPLSGDDSERLFYKRIFPQGSECPQELKQVSTDILKKCGGVPLAIITIASLLASSDQQAKTKDQWQALLKSIGRGLTEGASVAEMQQILSFSYYNLPSHLKTCLLYLSIFPEDYEIERDRLIWRWIAEGFVQGGTQETRSLFEIGESYFNDLINRSMIQPVDVDVAKGRAKACRVHDMVLDLIRILSRRENFVTVFDGTKQDIANSQSKVRRLSFQNSMSKLTTPQMKQVRSVTLFEFDADLIQPLSNFEVLRVLDLEGCDLEERPESSHKINLSCIGKLLHLRYLGLRETRVCGELPMEIGKLKFLQTLDLRGIESDVPSCVVWLRRLMCLYVDDGAKMPVGMGNLTSLEDLSYLRVDGSAGIEKELGKLIQLRVLKISLYARAGNESVFNSLVESLGNLQKLQSLEIYSYLAGKTRFDACWDRWVPPPHLRNLLFERCTSTLPRWINSSSLPLLCYLDIEVDEVRQGDIRILGKLPALRSLTLATTRLRWTSVKKLITGADAFPCVRKCEFINFPTATSIFPRGAMPRLESLVFSAIPSDIASGELDVCMTHLPSLQRLKVWLWVHNCISSSHADEAEAKLRLAAEAHPNRPILDIERFNPSYHP